MDWLLTWLWQSAVLVVTVEAMFVATPRLTAATRHAAWLALLAAVSAWPVVSMVLRPAAVPVPAPAAATAAPIVPVLVPSLPDGLTAMVVGLWLGLVLVRLAGVARGVAHVARLKRSAEPLDEARVAGLPGWSAAAAGGRRVVLCVSDHVAMPSALGLGRGIIALPRTITAALDAVELDRIVLHELAHLRRRDDWTRLGQALVEAVAGLHPAIWWIGRRLHLECETACDEFVVARIGDAKGYAVSLTRVAAFARRRVQPSLAPGVGHRGRDLRRRVRRVVRLHSGRRWTRRTSHAAGLGALAAALWVTAVVAPAVVFTGSTPRPPAPALTASPFVGVWPGAATVTATVDADSSLRRPVNTPRPVVPQPLTLSVGFGEVDALFSAGTGLPRPPLPTAPAPLASADLPPVAGTPTLRGPGGAAAIPGPAGADADRNPWLALADAGVAVGSGFKKAGVVTAGFFTRLGRSIAGGS